VQFSGMLRAGRQATLSGLRVDTDGGAGESP
jgi:hypothetical protein